MAGSIIMTYSHHHIFTSYIELNIFSQTSFMKYYSQTYYLTTMFPQVT